MADDTQAQPTPGQDQQVTASDPTPPAAATEVAPAAPTPVGDGPWSNDLAELFQDEAVRGQVDQFIRSKVQPYTTQLEQRAAVSEDATRLWEALSENPLDTYVAMTNEMFGEEAAAELLAALQTRLDGQPDPTQQTTEQQQQLDPRLENFVNWAEQQQTEQYYNQELSRVKEEHPEVVEQFFHKYVNVANGDFDEAYRLYTAEMAALAEQFGTQAVPVPREEAPPVTGSDTGTAQSSAAPTERKYESLDDAISDFMAEQRANREAPPVS